ncbi:MAG: hypothetical protein ACFCD0_23150 [Gemmataceae bacterium]
MAKDETGLVTRGILLFVGVAIIAVVALWFALPVFQGTGPKEEEPIPAHPTVSVLVVPQGPFPANVPWAALYAVQNDDNLPSLPGFQIRYNAVIALLRRGSTKNQSHTLAILCEILSEKKQMVNFRIETKEGGSVADVGAARRTVLNGLKAFLQWHQKVKSSKRFQPDAADVIRVREAVERLKESSNQALQEQAEATLVAVWSNDTV